MKELSEKELSVVRCQFSEIQIDRRSKVTKLFGVCPVVGLYHGAGITSAEVTRSCRGAWEGSRDARATLPATWAALPAGHHLSLAVVLSVAKPTERGVAKDVSRQGIINLASR